MLVLLVAALLFSGRLFASASGQGRPTFVPAPQYNQASAWGSTMGVVENGHLVVVTPTPRT